MGEPRRRTNRRGNSGRTGREERSALTACGTRAGHCFNPPSRCPTRALGLVRCRSAISPVCVFVGLRRRQARQGRRQRDVCRLEWWRLLLCRWHWYCGAAHACLCSGRLGSRGGCTGCVVRQPPLPTGNTGGEQAWDGRGQKRASSCADFCAPTRTGRGDDCACLCCLAHCAVRHPVEPVGNHQDGAAAVDMLLHACSCMCCSTICAVQLRHCFSPSHHSWTTLPQLHHSSRTHPSPTHTARISDLSHV